jgi:hypothetical protein
LSSTNKLIDEGEKECGGMVGQIFRKHEKKKRRFPSLWSGKRGRSRKSKRKRKLKRKRSIKREGIVLELSLSSREGEESKKQHNKERRDITRRITKKNVIEEKSAEENGEPKEEDK